MGGFSIANTCVTSAQSKSDEKETFRPQTTEPHPIEVGHFNRTGDTWDVPSKPLFDSMVALFPKNLGLAHKADELCDGHKYLDRLGMYISVLFVWKWCPLC